MAGCTSWELEKPANGRLSCEYDAANRTPLVSQVHGAPCPGIVLLTVRLRIEREIMRSMTPWLLMSTFHQGPVPPQVTAAGSCAQVTLPGTTPLEHPREKAWVQKEKDER